jgi:hypothetical protein
MALSLSQTGFVMFKLGIVAITHAKTARRFSFALMLKGFHTPLISRKLMAQWGRRCWSDYRYPRWQPQHRCRPLPHGPAKLLALADEVIE